MISGYSTGAVLCSDKLCSVLFLRTRQGETFLMFAEPVIQDQGNVNTCFGQQSNHSVTIYRKKHLE